MQHHLVATEDAQEDISASGATHIVEVESDDAKLLQGRERESGSKEFK